MQEEDTRKQRAEQKIVSVQTPQEPHNVERIHLLNRLRQLYNWWHKLRRDQQIASLLVNSLSLSCAQKRIRGTYRFREREENGKRVGDV